MFFGTILRLPIFPSLQIKNNVVFNYADFLPFNCLSIFQFVYLFCFLYMYINSLFAWLHFCLLLFCPLLRSYGQTVLVFLHSGAQRLFSIFLIYKQSSCFWKSLSLSLRPSIRPLYISIYPLKLPNTMLQRQSERSSFDIKDCYCHFLHNYSGLMEASSALSFSLPCSSSSIPSHSFKNSLVFFGRYLWTTCPCFFLKPQENIALSEKV